MNRKQTSIFSKVSFQRGLNNGILWRSIRSAFRPTRFQRLLSFLKTARISHKNHITEANVQKIGTCGLLAVAGSYSPLSLPAVWKWSHGFKMPSYQLDLALSIRSYLLNLVFVEQGLAAPCYAKVHLSLYYLFYTGLTPVVTNCFMTVCGYVTKQGGGQWVLDDLFSFVFFSGCSLNWLRGLASVEYKVQFSRDNLEGQTIETLVFYNKY